LGSGALMRLLFDTHVWLWTLRDEDRLSNATRALLDDQANERWLSPVSVWEVLLLAEKKRMTMDAEPRIWVARAIARTYAQEASMTHAIALESRLVDLPHADPADRFLVATAKVLDLHLVTADEKILRSKACQLIRA
jgi:PIN domain nuclease of toxin-antitoxin system